MWPPVREHSIPKNAIDTPDNSNRVSSVEDVPEGPAAAPTTTIAVVIVVIVAVAVTAINRVASLQFLELAAIEPDSTAPLAAIDADAVSVDLVKRSGLTTWTGHESNVESRDALATSINWKCDFQNHEPSRPRP
jgi:hypothetical protein